MQAQLLSYLAGRAILDGRWVRLPAQWMPPSVEVHIVYAGRRDLSPAARAFVDFMKECSPPTFYRQDDPLHERRGAL